MENTKVDEWKQKVEFTTYFTEEEWEVLSEWAKLEGFNDYKNTELWVKTFLPQIGLKGVLKRHKSLKAEKNLQEEYNAAAPDRKSSGVEL